MRRGRVATAAHHGRCHFIKFFGALAVWIHPPKTQPGAAPRALSPRTRTVAPSATDICPEKIALTPKKYLDNFSPQLAPRPSIDSRINAVSRLRAASAFDQWPPLLESKIPDKCLHAASPSLPEPSCYNHFMQFTALTITALDHPRQSHSNSGSRPRGLASRVGRRPVATLDR